MSISVMAAVFKRYPNGEGEMLLALALADHADDEGEHIWPSVGSLALKTRQSERSVQRHLRKMENDGWLIMVSTRKIGRGHTVEYRINPDWIKGDKLSPFKKERVTLATQKGDICDIAYKEEPSIEPSETRARKTASESKPTKPGKPDQKSITLPNWLDAKSWNQFVEHRKSIKSPLTVQAMALALRKLDGLRQAGSDPGAVIEQTILNRWTGLFPVRQQYAGAGGSAGQMSESELLRQGDDLGIEPRMGENMRDFTARVQRARTAAMH